MEECTEQEYSPYIDDLKDTYKSLLVSISDATVIANSKTLAHILPDLVPPIDCQYKVRFFEQDKKDLFTQSEKHKTVNLPEGIEKQFSLYRDYCVRIKRIFDQCKNHQFQLNPNTFNTSYSKIINNGICQECS